MFHKIIPALSLSAERSGKAKGSSMKKLLTLFSLVLMLAAMVAVPKPVSATSSCPLQGGSASVYCATYACGNPYGVLGSGYGSTCYYYCYDSICQSGNLPQCCE
jgi:hypothetical protein